jgi:hypothetical protein
MMYGAASGSSRMQQQPYSMTAAAAAPAGQFMFLNASEKLCYGSLPCGCKQTICVALQLMLLCAPGSLKLLKQPHVLWLSVSSALQPEDQPSEIFRYLWGQRRTTGECFLCQFLARHRAEPQERYTTCLFNKDW